MVAGTILASFNEWDVSRRLSCVPDVEAASRALCHGHGALWLQGSGANARAWA
jgi:hypothetical protein